MKRLGQITGKILRATLQNKQLSQSKTDLQNTSTPALGQRSLDVLEVYPEIEQFAIDFNLDNCMEKYIHIKSSLDGLKSRTVKLSELVNCYGEDNIVNWISAWLISVSAYMNFEISHQQSRTTSILILEELYMINLAEFSLFFKRLRKGQYGIFYGKFNGQTILMACSEFRMQRGKVISKMSEKEQMEILNINKL